MNLPENYLSEMKDLLQNEYDDYLKAMQEPPLSSLRINTSKISVEEFLKISPFTLSPVPWCSNGFYYGENERPGTHPYYYAGLYYIQEASAMAPASLLPVEKGDIILDACAAPGGKSTAIAAKMDETNLLISNDISSSRQNATLKNMERFGVTNAYIISDDLKKMAKKYRNYFDRILVDAPCSGEGMFRKDPSLIQSWIEKGSEAYVSVQREIALSCLSMLKEGGTMVYSTCTFSIKEDEEIIQYLMEKDPSLQLTDMHQEWFDQGKLTGMENCMRLFPHKIQGEGHFVAVLQKGLKSNADTSPPRNKSFHHPDFDAFMHHVSKPLDHGYFNCIQDKIYWLPDIPFDASNIRVLRSGLCMGTLKKDRFEPSQHLAFALKDTEFDNVLHLDIEDIRVEKYLRGETISYEGNEKEWILVCIDRYPLGFGKIQNHTIKNKLEKGFRKL
ncbi:MAG: RsmB/NOP family class I SAM-dependent RNA methyltransferase [Solobacterium sp.]|nr:RsmB/NOP family class I SAM-dependent RNA methyltransferase [Solobacterium sp.]